MSDEPMERLVRSLKDDLDETTTVMKAFRSRAWKLEDELAAVKPQYEAHIRMLTSALAQLETENARLRTRVGWLRRAYGRLHGERAFFAVHRTAGEKEIYRLHADLAVAEDRLRALMEAALLEHDRWADLPAVPPADKHNNWVLAHEALHDAVLDVLDKTGEPA